MRTFLILTLLLVVTGCVKHPPAQIAMSDPIKSNINSTDFVVVKTQDSVQADFVKTDYTQGGLLGALIVSQMNEYRKNDARLLVEPIISDLWQYQFEKKITDKFEGEGIDKKTQWLKIKSIKLADQRGIINPEAVILQNIKSDVLAVIKTGYLFTPGFDSLNINVSLNLYPATDKLKNEIPKDAAKGILWPIYRHQINYIWNLKERSMISRNSNASNWSKNNSEKVKSALDKTVDLITKEISSALEKPEVVKNNKYEYSI